MDTKALRQKVLDLAIRGKLVPQDPNDEPASVLLERIRQQKQQMVKEGKLKAKDIKNDSIIFVGEDNLHYEKFADGTVNCIEDEIPFELPDGWEWSRLASICSLISDIDHKMPKAVDNGVLFLSAKDLLNDGTINYTDDVKMISEEDFLRLSRKALPQKNDIIYSRIGACLGKARVVTKDIRFIVSYSCCTIRPVIIDSTFLASILDGDFVLNQAKEGTQSVGVPDLGMASIKQFLIPIPPLIEQQRIDGRLQYALNIVQQISTERDDLSLAVAQAKSKILDLAIRGKLVPQNPDDEPASVLLERIRGEKEDRIRQGKIKRDKKESIIFRGEDNSYYEKICSKVQNISDEIPFELPAGWIWCRGHSCFEGMESSKPQGDFFDYIDIDAIDNRLHRIKAAKHLPVSEAPSRASRAVRTGSVLFSLVRPYLENIALIEEKHSDCIASTGFYVCNSNGVLLPEFMYYLMISGYVVNGLNQYMKGDNSPSISKDNIENWLYPVPPLKEQTVICTKLRISFNLIENIEKSLS